jgi:hypothetical protein
VTIFKPAAIHFQIHIIRGDDELREQKIHFTGKYICEERNNKHEGMIYTEAFYTTTAVIPPLLWNLQQYKTLVYIICWSSHYSDFGRLSLLLLCIRGCRQHSHYTTCHLSTLC